MAGQIVGYPSGIYAILNLIDGKRYVGSAQNFTARWKAHRFHLGKGSHHSRYLQAAWNKHGGQNFEFLPMLYCEVSALLEYEQLAIDALRPEYNSAPVAGSCRGVKHSEEVRANISARMMGNQHTLGYRHTEEAREKLREKQLGVASPTKGTTRDRGAVAATAAAHRGMKRSAETCAKISAKAKGRKRSRESIEKAASKRRGVSLSAAHRAHLLGNQHAAGREQSPAERQNRSEKVKAAWTAKKAAGIPWR